METSGTNKSQTVVEIVQNGRVSSTVRVFHPVNRVRNEGEACCAFLHACSRVVATTTVAVVVENCAVARTSPLLHGDPPRLESRESQPNVPPPSLSLSVSTIRERRKEERRARRRDNNSQKYASCRRPYRGSASSNNLELCTCITWRSAAASCVTKSIPFESRVFSPSSSPDLLSLRMEMEKFEDLEKVG